VRIVYQPMLLIIQLGDAAFVTRQFRFRIGGADVGAVDRKLFNLKLLASGVA